MTKQSLRATDVGEFIRYKSCERRFKLGFNNRELAMQLPFAGRLFATLDPVLKAAGRKREKEWEQYLIKLGFSDLCPYEQRPEKQKSVTWSEFQKLAADLRPRQKAFVRELSISSDIGAFHIFGCIDFALIIWRKGKPVLRLVECKASRKDQTYHRAQLAVYKVIAEKLLESNDGKVSVIEVDLQARDIECVVARIDEDSNKNQAIMDIAPFDLSMIEADVCRLLESDGPLQRILATDVDALNYQIGSKCDDCIFNIHCLPESARQRKLQLLGLDPSTIRALQAGQIADLDDLASIDLSSERAHAINKSAPLSLPLPLLKTKAFARLSTLPNAPADCYPVQFLSYRLFSQLPEHDICGQRLLRVYICVDYDYTENRIASLSAHITASDGSLYTGWQKVDGKSIPDPHVKERVKSGVDQDGYTERELQGVDVIVTRESEWSGTYNWDTEAERQLLEDFFSGVVSGIKKAAGGRGHAPVHFYFWSRIEISRLIEACSRSSSTLLGHLQQLLGCRESLEQLIFSCVQEEVNNRYGLGWTGRGLLVASSLNWFGWSYHWNREVNGVPTWIDREFAQDLFDFKTDLSLKDGQWLKNPDDESKHRFEIRSQFNDSLPAGYLQAFWGVLPPASEASKDNARRAMENFHHASRPGLLNEYLRARVQALRWIEEKIVYKSSALQKPPVILNSLPEFSLKVANTATAAIDFLRLNFHITFTDWLASHLISPLERVAFGRSLAVKNVHSKQGLLIAEINTDGSDVSMEDLQIRCPFEEGDFVRISPCDEDLNKSQTLNQFSRGGITGIIQGIDWQTGRIEMTTISLKNADRYRLLSRRIENEGQVFAFATIDDNPSDFVSGRIEKRLDSKFGRHVYSWFDRTAPQLPAANELSELQIHRLRTLLRSFFPAGDGSTLAADQINAVLLGLNATAQLLQGPPGTGKTMTTAVAILTRVLARLKAGGVIFLSANTHTAINTLLERVVMLKDAFSTHASEQEMSMPPLQVFKTKSRPGADAVAGITFVESNDDGLQRLKAAQRSSVVIIGGTAGSLLKLSELDSEFCAELLIIDEASMMVFPHFLALASLVKKSGSFMLAGDHRQLSPILAQDWEKDDRPPTVLYQPYASAYDAVRDLSAVLDDKRICMSSLQYTFRLPDAIRKLIARLYRLDEVELHGPPSTVPPAKPVSTGKGSLNAVWHGQTGLYLVSHKERESRQCNTLEVDIIESILEEAADLAPHSVAIVTPHRAQRALLQKHLQRFSREVDLIDTVERLQGGERPTVIFSATVSDPAAIASSVEFILDLNRSNVAFSRAKQRLIVVCSEELINFIPASLDQYEEALLWKSLREVCSHLVSELQLKGHGINVFAPI